jgi:hypothetical protein
MIVYDQIINYWMEAFSPPAYAWKAWKWLLIKEVRWIWLKWLQGGKGYIDFQWKMWRIIKTYDSINYILFENRSTDLAKLLKSSYLCSYFNEA